MNSTKANGSAVDVDTAKQIVAVVGAGDKLNGEGVFAENGRPSIAGVVGVGIELIQYLVVGVAIFALIEKGGIFGYDQNICLKGGYQ